MRINKNNPILQQTIHYVTKDDKLLDSIEYEMLRQINEIGNTTLQDLYFQRFNQLIGDYTNLYFTSEEFNNINYKNLPFDLATDFNIQMANHLLEKEIDHQCNKEIAKIKLPTLKWYEEIYRNPESWREINARFGMTPVL